jgi:hypothetical protein
MAELTDLELLNELGVETKVEKKAALTPREERIIAGFEDIQRFYEEHGRKPEHGENKDIFERLYATRLDRLRELDECRELVLPLDHQGLLNSEPYGKELNGYDGSVAASTKDYEGKVQDIEEVSDEALLAELGVDAPQEGDINFLKHVKPRAEIKAAEEVANRTPCEDFESFKPLFERVQKELELGTREAKLLTKNAQVNKGDFFILFGQKVYVAEISEERTHGFDKNDYRLRVIYDNGTESDLLMRSLQRVLDKDDAGRRIIELSAGPLFDDIEQDEGLASGTIYVLRSQSTLTEIGEHREIIHKIGVTGGKVDKRIANASLDATFLLAGVDVVATYELYDINRVKLEKLLHRFFDHVRLDIEIPDRFGNKVKPREWFLVPLFIINEVVEKIKEGSLSGWRYDAESVALVKSD